MIVIIGATGKIGGEVARRLVQRDVPVRAFVRDPAKAGELAGLGVELARGDLGDRRSLDAAMAGVERLFLVSVQDPRQAELQGNAVVAAGEAGVSHVVKVSGIGPSVSPSGPADVGRQHWQTERQIEDSGLPFTFLRPNFFMQNLLETAAPMVSRLGMLVAPMDDAPIAMVDARDIGAVGAAVLTGEGHAGQVYDVTGPRAFSYRGLAGVLGAATGRTVTYINVPPALAMRALKRQGEEEWYVEHLGAMTGLFRAGAGAIVSSVVRDLAGREPRSIEAFAGEHASRFRGDEVPQPLQRAARIALGSVAGVGRVVGRGRS